MSFLLALALSAAWGLWAGYIGASFDTALAGSALIATCWFLARHI